tara:strand:- start:1005 stop:2072 length:1068 start_codon:yes stop_codon:yes gene_type:complete
MSNSSSKEPEMTFGWANAMAQALESEGLDSQLLFEKSDIPYQTSVDPSSRLKTRKASRLYRLAVEASGNPSFGLKVGVCLQPMTLYTLGYSIFVSSNLHEVCEKLERYFELVSDNASHKLSKEGDLYKLHIQENNSDVSQEAIDAWLSFLIKVCRDIYRPNFSPARIELIRPEPTTHAEDFRAFFRAPVVFSAEENAIYFNKEDLFDPLLWGDTELARRIDEVVIERLARLKKNDIIRRVEAQIVRLLPTGQCSKERVASELHMSLSNLYSKLEKKQTSYQEILENLRSSLARHYMEQQNLPITQITYLLGFSDTSNFSRAFRRWTGESPSEYRRNAELRGGPRNLNSAMSGLPA